MKIFLMSLILCNALVWAGSEHDESEHAHAESEHNETNSVHLNPEQIRLAGIEVQAIQLEPLNEFIEAPGETLLNLYATSQVTPRIEAQVLERLVKMGDRVKKDQPLVKLSSADMADAQGEALVAAKDWQRMDRLGKEIISKQQHLNARVAWQKARARLLAYGMTLSQIKQLIEDTQFEADGSFVLLSPQDGTIIKDDFVIGQMIEPGDILFEITDESTIWVEAQINPVVMRQIKLGALAQMQVAGRWLQGKIIQMHHELDPTTRTMGVRIEFPNPDDHLHPGQFVTVLINTIQQSEPVLSLAKQAVLLGPDGDWQVFVEKAPGEFAAVEVELIRELPHRVIISGLEPGTRIVVRGAFFVQSELNKSGFAVHNH